jgi:hypothetical protein
MFLRAKEVVMAVSGRVAVLNEVTLDQPKDWQLCFQRCRYMYDDGSIQDGFRFIWRRPDGSLQAARGQARIPSLKDARLLMAEAEKAGWGHYELDDSDRFVEGTSK